MHEPDAQPAAGGRVRAGPRVADGREAGHDRLRRRRRSGDTGRGRPPSPGRSVIGSPSSQWACCGQARISRSKRSRRGALERRVAIAPKTVTDHVSLSPSSVSRENRADAARAAAHPRRANAGPRSSACSRRTRSPRTPPGGSRAPSAASHFGRDAPPSHRVDDQIRRELLAVVRPHAGHVGIPSFADAPGTSPADAHTAPHSYPGCSSAATANAASIIGPPAGHEPEPVVLRAALLVGERRRQHVQ